MDIIAVICALLWSSLYCHFGNSASDHVLEIGDIVYGLNWFEQPLEMQKYMILIMARSKRRIEFSGFSLITCSMEMFGKVCNFKSI